MDKKQIAALLQDIVETVALDNDVTEIEARTFVGVALRKGKDVFLRTVCIPTLALASPKADAPETDEKAA